MARDVQDEVKPLSENPFPSLTEEMGFFGGLGGLSERLAQAGKGTP
jgi:hypothetical protein